MRKINEMTKSELKTGMLVVCKGGWKAIVLKGSDKEDRLIGGEGFTDWMPLGQYKEDLTCEECSIYNIIEVYESIINSISLTIEKKKLLFPIDTIQLTESYKAVVKKEEKIVEVGCQRIPFEKVEELHKLINS